MDVVFWILNISIIPYSQNISRKYNGIIVAKWTTVMRDETHDENYIERPSSLIATLI